MSDTVTIREIDPEDTTALYCRYDREQNAQGCFIALNLETGDFWADYDPEIGNGIPESVFHHRTLRWPVPCLTAKAALQLLRDLAPAAERVLAGADIEWNGSNHVGELTLPAQQAAGEIAERGERLLADAVADSDVIGECEAADWFSYAGRDEIAKEFGITAASADEDLDAATARADREALEISTPGPLVMYGTLEYFRDLRDYLRETAEGAAG